MQENHISHFLHLFFFFYGANILFCQKYPSHNSFISTKSAFQLKKSEREPLRETRAAVTSTNLLSSFLYSAHYLPSAPAGSFWLRTSCLIPWPVQQSRELINLWQIGEQGSTGQHLKQKNQIVFLLLSCPRREGGGSKLLANKMTNPEVADVPENGRWTLLYLDILHS